MISFDNAVARRRDRFVERMQRAGFTYLERRNVATGDVALAGTVTAPDGRDIAVEVEVREGFPYQMPRVRPQQDAGSRSWHQEADGSLCLWTGREDDLPWTDSERLIARIVDWFTNDAAGWPDDDPDLDLERYFERADGPLVLYRDIDELVGKRIKTRQGPNDTVELIRSGKSAARIGRRHGWVVDLGELERPVHDWSEIIDRLGDLGSQIESEMVDVGGGYLLVAYRRGQYTAAVALHVDVDDDEVTLSALESANMGDDVLRLRAGPDADRLADLSVAVVGVGAVGSFAADLLARAGVGRLVLVDPERLRPGNCVRHLAGLQHLGKYKTAAVRDVIETSGHEPARGIEVCNAGMRTPAKVSELLEEVDLLVDATGSAPVAALVEDAVGFAELHAVSGYLQRDGAVVRVDRSPVDTDEDVIDPVPPVDRSDRTVLREAGCGDPVSPTPPHAVVAAASLAVNATVDVLCGRSVPPSIVTVLAPQADVPYDRRMVLS